MFHMLEQRFHAHPGADTCIIKKVIKRFVELKQRAHITYLEQQDFV